MEILCTLLGIYLIVLIIRMVLSWFPVAPGSGLELVASALYAVTEPVLSPIRRAIPPVRMGSMGLDLSVMIVFFGIVILRGIICP